MHSFKNGTEFFTLPQHHQLDQLRLYLLTESGEERVACLENMRESHKQAFLAMMRTASSRPVGVSLLHHDMCAFFPCQYSEEFKTVAAKLAGKLGIDADACAARIKRMLDPLPPAMARAQPQDTAPSEFMPPQLRVNMLSAARRPFTDLAYMQSGALVEAGITVAREGFDVHPHVHIPHACSEFDVERVAAVVKSAHTDVTKRDKFDIRFMIGVVIDTPRALWSAGAFSSLKHVDGIIFSTDELSEMFTGMTRHDSATFMNRYTANRDVDYDPYESIDLAVLGEAIMDAAQQCKLANPSLNIAARGKLCGDKDTVAFFEQCGLNCISCPRSKIAVAKLAAAHARIEMQAMEAIRSKNMAKPFAGIAEQHPKPRLSSRAGPTIAKAKSLSASSSTGAQKDFGETMKDLFAIKPRGGEVGTP
jgi:pyruvate,orthophosphate dikinase